MGVLGPVAFPAGRVNLDAEGFRVLWTEAVARWNSADPAIAPERSVLWAEFLFHANLPMLTAAIQDAHLRLHLPAH